MGGAAVEKPRARCAVGRSACAGLLDARWDDLVARQLLPNPTLGSVWLREALPLDPGTPLFVVVERGERLLAAGTFSLRSVLDPDGPRLATWLCGGRPLMSLEILVDPEAPEAAGALVDGLFREAAGLRKLRCLEGGPLATALAGRCVGLERTPDPWTGYTLELPAAEREPRRREVAYQARRAARRGVAVEVHTATEPEPVAAALEHLFELHGEIWGSHPGDVTHFSTSAAQRAWHRRAVRRMAEAGQALLVEVREQGRPVASLLALRSGRGAVLHTMASRRGGVLLGPGHSAIFHALEALAAAGCRRLDLGAGAGLHKHHYRPRPAPYVRISAARTARDGRRLHRLRQRRRRRLRLGRASL